MTNNTFQISKRAAAVSAALFALSCSNQLMAGKLDQTVAPNVKVAPAATAIQGQYIVVFKNNIVNREVTALAGKSYSELSDSKVMSLREQTVKSFTNELSSIHNAKVKHQYHAALNGFSAKMTAAEANAMAADSRVDFIEQDQTVRATDTQTNATWGIDRIDQPNLPLNRTYVYDQTGSGVTAYIIDTGIVSHSEFGSRLRTGFDAITNGGNGQNDCHGHGTHVAGTVGGTTYGVAKGVTLVPVRVLDCNGSGQNSQVVAGIDWVRSNASGPSVANMSLGGGYSAATDSAVNNAINSGVTVVVAAGNSNSDACVGSPNGVAAAITVASSTSSDSRSSFSSWGQCIDIFAPGSDITSASKNGGSTVMSGTSMASPHVAGAAALVLQGNPNASASQVDSALKSASVAKISDLRGSPNRLLQVGGGGGTTPPPPPPSGSTPLQNGVTVTGISGASKDNNFFTLAVPANATNLRFVTAGGSGDADLYVKFGSAPTLNSYDCKSTSSTSNETCSVSSQQGTFHAMVHSWNATSNVSLTGSYTSGGTPPPPPPTDGSDHPGSLSGTGDADYLPLNTSTGKRWWRATGTTTIEGVLTMPSAVDFELELQKWSSSGGWQKVTDSTNPAGQVENVAYPQIVGGYYRFKVYSYSGSGNYNLNIVK